MLILSNITASPLVYLSGSITVPANGTYNVPDTDIFEVSLDAQIRADLSTNNLQISDGVSNFGTNDAIAFLNRIIGTKDKNGRGISSTILTGKTGLDVNVISPITTTPAPSIYTSKTFYAEILSVPNSVETDILTYTVPTGKSALLSLIDASGTNIAEYTVYVNGNPISKRRTMFGSDLNCTLSFANDGFILTSNDVVVVKVMHIRPYLGTFNTNLQVKEEI